jgi:ABC-type uncharacterized transport system auxiliary subunit
MHYYTLQLPSPPAAGDPKTGFVLAVEPFRSTDVLRDDRILYYESATQLGFYQQHRWVTDPPTMVQELAAQRLRQTGVFAHVQSPPLSQPVDYLLKGRVLNLEEIDYEGGVKGRAGLELTLLRSRDHKIVWSARRQVENAVQEKGVAGVVNALDGVVKQVLEEMTQAVVAQVENDVQVPSGRTTP